MNDDTTETPDDADTQAAADLLAAIQQRLRSAAGTHVPTTTMGRFGRTAALALRGGVAAMGARLRGRSSTQSGSGLGVLDARATEDYERALFANNARLVAAA